ncbi:hypothetical protein AVEN_12295-1 [Araneus ventricosus]|uniref:Reverse transcriptase domain-containing protein n=1 Tax=Araneus ventricosus TaxID=182803 RepID=A0A4Y2E8X8_ARAVE|nr:hypothetical protein AVEN_12295-1 [Araneus ventricosus]
MSDFFETIEHDVECLVFADDIFIFCAHQSLEYITKKLQKTIENVYHGAHIGNYQSVQKKVLSQTSPARLFLIESTSLNGVRISWKESITFLGIHFSKRNQNRSILNSIRNKAIKRIDALKGIAFKHCGPRTRDLITLTDNGISSFFFYASQIINKLPESHMKACNIIQTKALRIALGVPQWTPNKVLLQMADQEILSEKIKRLSLQSFIKDSNKSQSTPFHPSIKKTLINSISFSQNRIRFF